MASHDDSLESELTEDPFALLIGFGRDGVRFAVIQLLLSDTQRGLLENPLHRFDVDPPDPDRDHLPRGRSRITPHGNSETTPPIDKGE
jgi:hypothetical protein